LHGTGIGVLLVSPATVETEIWQRMIEDRGRTSWRAKRAATPDFVARKTVDAICRGRREVLPGLTPKLLRLVHRLCPSVVAWVTERRH
jgi:short-subunit dehydrogenase